MPRPAPPRTDDLKLIHIAKRDLALDDDAYRDLLWTIARVRSAKDLDHAGRARVLDHFRKCGWQPKTKAPAGEWAFVFRLDAARQPQAKKVFRLAQALGALQSPPLPVMPKAWVEGILVRMRGFRRESRGPDAARPSPSRVQAPIELATDEELRALIVALETHRARLSPEAACRT